MKLLLVGDVMLGRLVNARLRRKSPQYPWGDTLPLFTQADCRICNLECVIADRGSPWVQTPKVFHFRSDAKNVSVLQAARIDAVSLANNHTLDYGYDAMFEMLGILDARHIARAGAGANREEASRAAFLERQGEKIGLISFTDNEPEWEATDQKKGVFYVPVDLEDDRASVLLELVRGVKKKVDVLVVAAHWGPNWGYAPPAEHVSFAHALVDAGADLVFGHSAHVFRGVEIYDGRPILYSTGDFIDDYAIDEVQRNDESFVFVIDTDEKVRPRLRLYPTVIRDCQARRAPQGQDREIAEKMQALCAALSTQTRWDEAERCLLW